MKFSDLAAKLLAKRAAAQSDEQRLTLRLWAYWDNLRGERAYPIAPSRQLADVGQHGFTLDLEAGASEPVFRCIGQAITEFCGRDFTGRPVSEAPPDSVLAWVGENYPMVIDQESPIAFDDATVDGPDGKIRLRGILLPFSDDGTRIDCIVGTVTFTQAASERAPAGPAEAAIDADDPFAWLRQHRSELPPPPTLADRLATCKALARKVRAADSRSRAALYRALAEAYAFHCEAEANSAAYDRLLTKARIKQQARAPFTPVIKLIFGADCDKTRLAEYSAALSFAKRNGRTADDVADFLQAQAGGMKGCVQAERAARRADQGKPEDQLDRARAALRQLPPIGEVVDQATGTGEFVLLLGRRAAAEPGIVHILQVLDESQTAVDGIVKRWAKGHGARRQADEAPGAGPRPIAMPAELIRLSKNLGGLKREGVDPGQKMLMVPEDLKILSEKLKGLK